MNREVILSEIERLQPWFHCINLGDGLVTKTASVLGEPVDHPAGPWEIIGKCLPSDLTGRSVLDIGCNAGFYSIEARRRGAQRVLGVDGQRHHVRQAVFVRQVLGLDIEYRRMNVYELTRARVGQFDITLALGLVYHLKHLVLALENLSEVTRDLLIVETGIMPPEQTPEPIAHHLGQLHPLAYIENPMTAKEQVANWFLPSVSALTALLRSAGFDETETVEVKNERAIIVCRKSRQTHPNTEVRRHYVATITLISEPVNCRVNELLSFTLRVKNVGLEHWPARAKNGDEFGVVHLASHLLRENEDEVAWDYARADLPHDLEPGAMVDVEMKARAPATPGNYIVEFDLVAEHIAWFEDFGSGTLRHLLQIVG